MKESTVGYPVFHDTMVDMTFQQVELAAQSGALILLPIGVVEAHGPHLPLGVDSYVSMEFARQVRTALDDWNLAALIAPPYFWGTNTITNAFAGSFTFRLDVLRAHLVDILCSLHRWGFRDIFVLNFHGDDTHYRVVAEAVREVHEAHQVGASLVLSGGEARNLGYTGDESFLLVYRPSGQEEGADASDASEPVDLHAGAVETGFMLRYYPDLVNMSALATLQATVIKRSQVPIWESGGAEASALAPQAYVGDPAAFNTREIEELVEWLVDHMAAAIASAVTGRQHDEEHSP